MSELSFPASRSPSPEHPSSGDSDADQPPPAPVYRGHTRWKQAQPHTPGQHHATLPDDDDARVRRRKRRKVVHERHLSRDFFLILTFCFVLACFLICLTRPALRTWFSGPMFVDLDEF